MSGVVKMAGSVVTPLGMELNAVFDSIMENRSSISLNDGTFGIPQPFMASLFNREEVMSEASERGIIGYTFFDTILILSAQKAVIASGVDPSSADLRFVISSIKGNVDMIETDPLMVPLSGSADRLAKFFDNPNPAIVVSNACISGLTALDHARKMLLSGVCRNVVVVGAECQSSFIVSGFQSLKALSDNFCKPFDADRSGLNLGEAAAAIVLGLKDNPDVHDWCLENGATRNDACHISGPSRVGEGSYRTLRYVLEGVDKSEIAFINVHGTATIYNDEMESCAIERAGLSDLPVNALKGSLGHTMGAAGVLETLISMEALDRGLVLPTKGFDRLGVSHPVNVSSSVRVTEGRAFIKLLSGFGGCNAAMLFRKGGRV